jgi:hypothetical protein
MLGDLLRPNSDMKRFEVTTARVIVAMYYRLSKLTTRPDLPIQKRVESTSKEAPQESEREREKKKKRRKKEANRVFNMDGQRVYISSNDTNKSAPLLSSVKGDGGARALSGAVQLSATSRGTIGIAQTLASNELQAFTIANIGGSRRVRVDGASDGGAISGRRSCRRRRGSCRGSSSPGRVKSASLLARLEGGARAGADARAAEGGTTGRCAVGVAKAGTGYELQTLAVADVLGAGWIRAQGRRDRKDRGQHYDGVRNPA